VIQRVVINGQDTERPRELSKLKRQVLDMTTVEQVEEMLAQIPANTNRERREAARRGAS
jgi:hypothetical protein